MKNIFISIFFLVSFKTYSQQIKCNELFNYVVSHGYEKGSVSSYVMNSSWLKKVTAYDYDNVIYVVAEIKENEYSFQTKSYIFSVFQV
jgi:hypothetical protein